MAESVTKIVRPVFDNPFIRIIETPDGLIKRDPEIRTHADADSDGTSRVLSRDVTLDLEKKTKLRLYIPRTALCKPSKLPVIIYYHGGGFVFLYADSAINDAFCKRLVENVGAMVVSLDYRLAPENRLPAAYEDAMDGLYWFKNAEDNWLRDYADLTQCYLAGTSSGGNIAYHTGLHAVTKAKELEPLKIKGLILHHPYFSGTKRTPSEEKLANDPLLPLFAIDQMFDLSLPKGVDHDHEYSNPFINGGSKHIEKMKALGWRILVTGCFDDPLVDAATACADMLENKGVRTVKFFSDGYHAMEVFDPSMSEPFYSVTKEFVFQLNSVSL